MRVPGASFAPSGCGALDFLNLWLIYRELLLLLSSSQFLPGNSCSVLQSRAGRRALKYCSSDLCYGIHENERIISIFSFLPDGFTKLSTMFYFSVESATAGEKPRRGGFAQA